MRESGSSGGLGCRREGGGGILLKSGGCGLAGERQRQRAAAAASCRRATAASLWSAVSLRKARLCEWRLPARSAVLCVCFGSAVSCAVERGWLCCVRCVIHAAVLCGCVSCAVGYPAVLCVCCNKASYKGACVLPSDCRWGSRFSKGPMAAKGALVPAVC